jgi:hypothetical protein
MRKKIKEWMMIILVWSFLVSPPLAYFTFASGVARVCTCNEDFQKGLFFWDCTCVKRRSFGDWKWDWWNEEPNPSIK